MLVLGPRAGFSLGVATLGKVGFSLDAFMAAQSDGLFFDFTKTDRLFQETSGAPSSGAPGDVIGLAMSGRSWDGKTLAQVISSQPELTPNGTFDTDLGGWDASASTPPSTIVWSAGKAVAQTDGVNPARFRRTVGTPLNKTYRLSTAGTMPMRVGTVASGTQVLPDLAAAARYFMTQSDPTWLSVFTTVNGQWLDDVSLKEIPGKHGVQAFANYKPKFQATGAAFDGIDDRLASPYAVGAGNNWAMDRATIPAVLAATQILFGAQNASGDAFYLGVTTSGALRAKIGQTVIDSTGVDLRGGQHVIGVWTDGATAYLYADGAIVGTGAWTGSMPTAMTWLLGAVNNNGTAAAFFGGSLLKPVAGRSTLDLTIANRIRSQLLAA